MKWRSRDALTHQLPNDWWLVCSTCCLGDIKATICTTLTLLATFYGQLLFNHGCNHSVCRKWVTAQQTAGSEGRTVHLLTQQDLLPLLIMTGHLHNRKATKYKLNCFFVSVPTRPLTLGVIPDVSENERIHRRWMREPWLRTLHHPVRQSLQWLSPISLSPSFVTYWDCGRPPPRRHICSAPTT